MTPHIDLPETDTIQLVAYEDPLFLDILRLRKIAYGREQAGIEDAIDPHSLHFVYRHNARITGSLRVTLKRDGPLESEAFYPKSILNRWGDVLGASSRMCVDRQVETRTNVPLELTRFAWRTVIPMGIRLDVCKARLKAIPYYMKRLGYYYVKGSQFDFDLWKARCGLIALPANPGHHSALSDVFEGIHNPCVFDLPLDDGCFTSSYKLFNRKMLAKEAM